MPAKPSHPGQPKAKLKVVVRQLPWSLPVEKFQELVGEALMQHATYFVYTKGKQDAWRTIPSRAFMAFDDTAHVTALAEALDGKYLVDQKGAKQQITVEHAPLQRIPKDKPEADQRKNTIEEDPEYLAFVEQITKPPVPAMSAERWLEQREREQKEKEKDPIKVTPLMEELRQRRMAGNTESDRRRRRREREREREREKKEKRKADRRAARKAEEGDGTATEAKQKEITEVHKPGTVDDGSGRWVLKQRPKQAEAASPTTPVAVTEKPTEKEEPVRQLEHTGRGRRHREAPVEAAQPRQPEQAEKPVEREAPMASPLQGRGRGRGFANQDDFGRGRGGARRSDAERFRPGRGQIRGRARGRGLARNTTSAEKPDQQADVPSEETWDGTNYNQEQEATYAEAGWNESYSESGGSYSQNSYQQDYYSPYYPQETTSFSQQTEQSSDAQAAAALAEGSNLNPAARAFQPKRLLQQSENQEEVSVPAGSSCPSRTGRGYGNWGSKRLDRQPREDTHGWRPGP
eukprot:TRINITY_DN3365_c0_g1_i1.p1 TRINITY_DN3365_c0_g1~~TRINITY_DN3365_c0_g1_i1.p1  ORF type:complete len:518 (-),score=86.97 TRINITY_DN3365_c0_g1_i1:417-1970(-)